MQQASLPCPSPPGVGFDGGVNQAYRDRCSCAEQSVLCCAALLLRAASYLCGGAASLPWCVMWGVVQPAVALVQKMCCCCC